MITAGQLNTANKFIKKTKKKPKIETANKHMRRYLVTSPEGNTISMFASIKDFFHAGPSVPLYLDYLWKCMQVLII